MPERDAPIDPQSVRILIADDDPGLLESLRGLLTIQGYPVRTAAGGGAAIEALREKHYDLLLLDLTMPELNGLDVLRFMQAAGLETLTVVVSGNSTVEDVAGALREGAHDYLKKPYEPAELLATVRNALHHKALEDANRTMRARLEKSERLHRVIVNNSPDIVFVLGADHRFRFVNSRVHELLGYARRDLIDRSVFDLVEPEDRDKAEYFFEQAASQHPHIRSVELALQPGTPSRSRRFFEVAVWPSSNSDDADNGETLIYGTARDITDRKESEAFINFQAYHDLLTRLPNRALFRDRVDVAISHAQRSGTQLAVLFIDLNRFKVINDSLGHTVGDRLLQEVAQRLQACIRKGDTLSRFGGDEFTLLIPGLASNEAAIQVADKILESLQAPFKIGDQELFVGASIGIAIYPDAGDNLEALIKNADIAMYREKSSGKTGVRVYSPDMGGHPPRRLQLEQDMRRALERDEFHILYQPQVDTETGHMVGVEALIRWDHPTLGLLGPAEFIPVAEETRLIVDLDRLTLRTAIREMQRHSRDGYPELRLAVNLSPVLVERDDFVEDFLGILGETGFPPDLLEVEITENLLMSDTPDTVHKLNRLGAAGVQIAVDDFGTGYSSLSYLQKLPIHTLKIDRSFTHTICREDEACIVNAIISMARGLQMNIVAEGVETEAHRDYLRDLECPMIQGFLFGQPAPLHTLLENEALFAAPTTCQ
ncbi:MULTISPECIES: EAL domain-containing protein [Thioalkalivibrio]|uniref:EAL domain-containing response regulator n=1 Tax=Thioalkalivibrio TaxID=106633 RepID=UPI000380F9E2|nr:MULTISPECIES: EAL domain-containing protein [Thioalkalivibrio]OOC49374.1 two-component system response regulator [Thioalkalivibrio versutus]